MATARPPRIRSPNVVYALRAWPASHLTVLNARFQKTRERPRGVDVTGSRRSELFPDPSSYKSGAPDAFSGIVGLRRRLRGNNFRPLPVLWRGSQVVRQRSAK